MEQDIGGRLRLVREQLGLSQRQLARQSGVANATISQIEAGKLNPTVSLLKKTSCRRRSACSTGPEN
jgi:transcriptional regulator with XRE-family HTH domain